MELSEQLALINRFRTLMPVDVEGLSWAIGVPVRYANLEDETSGMIERLGNDKFRITVNANHPKTRQRFTIAHELGHYIMHRSKIGIGIDENKAYRSKSAGIYRNAAIGPAQETQANQFAVSVLMPSALLRKVREMHLNSPKAAARELGVSEQAYCIIAGVPYPHE